MNPNYKFLMRSFAALVAIFACFIGIFRGTEGGILLSLAPISYSIALGSREAEQLFATRNTISVMCVSVFLLLVLSLSGIVSFIFNLLLMAAVGSGIYASYSAISAFRPMSGEGKR